MCAKIFYKEHLLNFLTKIPNWKVTSYSSVGNLFWLHHRKVAKILSENTEITKYPCYKVVNKNGEIGWYNNWKQNKYKLLKKEGIHIINWKIHSSYFWSPVFSNFFIWLPLLWKEKDKFEKLIFDIKNFLGSQFVFQKKESPHITIKFLGKIWLEEMNYIKNQLLLNYQNFSKISKRRIKLNKISDFWNKVFFLSSFDNNWLSQLKYFHELVESILQWYDVNHSYVPHLTLFKNKRNLFVNYSKLKKIIKNYDIFIDTSLIRFYLAVGGFHQIPIYDIRLFD